MYLESFTLPTENEQYLLDKLAFHNGGQFGYIDNPYPCRIFSDRNFSEIYFKPITIFYGGNGSGKTTLLNLISEKLELKRTAPFNKSEMFGLYVKYCSYTLDCDEEGYRYRIPNGSRMITSDDVFDYMLAIRSNNDRITKKKKKVKSIWRDLVCGPEIKLTGMENYDIFRTQVFAKNMSRRKFLRKTVGLEAKLKSNGETALLFFENKLENNTLYCLDEPENSLSPKLQLKLVSMIEEMAKYCRCQFIISTHSPFFLAMEGARIFDLDSTHIEIKEWWQLENMKIYYDFFTKRKQFFEHNFDY